MDAGYCWFQVEALWFQSRIFEEKNGFVILSCFLLEIPLFDKKYSE